MKIVIFGSTGGTGLILLRQALERGHKVIAFARNPQMVSVSGACLDVLQGDVLDPDAVRHAVAGADAAISVLGVRLGQAPGTVRSEGTRNIVNALSQAGIERFVSVSTIGAGDSRDRLSWVARFLLPRIIGAERLEEAERQEEIVRQSKLNWTILRPPQLVDRPGTGRYKIGADLYTGLRSNITRADLAAALL
ncbi:MAG: SDR family oxidoreductase, partial [Caldilineaceae bacterium]|nr:SDR family oxidoreductase [Caldilineaceae bacterium]